MSIKNTVRTKTCRCETRNWKCYSSSQTCISPGWGEL